MTEALIIIEQGASGVEIEILPPEQIELVLEVEGDPVEIVFEAMPPTLPGTNPRYRQVLDAVYSLLVPSVEHGLSALSGLTLLSPNGGACDVYYELRLSENSAYIESNISLLNHTLILY